MEYAEILGYADTDSERLALVAATLLTWATLDTPMPPAELDRIATGILESIHRGSD